MLNMRGPIRPRQEKQTDCDQEEQDHEEDVLDAFELDNEESDEQLAAAQQAPEGDPVKKVSGCTIVVSGVQRFMELAVQLSSSSKAVPRYGSHPNFVNNMQSSLFLLARRSISCPLTLKHGGMTTSSS